MIQIKTNLKLLEEDLLQGKEKNVCILNRFKNSYFFFEKKSSAYARMSCVFDYKPDICKDYKVCFIFIIIIIIVILNVSKKKIKNFK